VSDTVNESVIGWGGAVGPASSVPLASSVPERHVHREHDVLSGSDRNEGVGDSLGREAVVLDERVDRAYLARSLVDYKEWSGATAD
jgi:hypothetical protein